MLIPEHSDTLSPVEESPVENQKLFFGPFAPERYAPYAQAELQKQFGDPQKNAAERSARHELWQNYQLLKDYLTSEKRRELSLVQRIYTFFTETQTPDGQPKFPYAQKQLTERPTDGLGHHLQDAQESARLLLLKNQGKEARLGSYLTDRQLHLITEVITPLHDVLKFLGSKEAQIMPDHEVLTSELVREFFAGQTAELGPLGSQTLTPEDVEFIAGVIGDHENIQKEEGRSEFSTSTNPVERGKAVFFLIDTFGKTFEISENSELQLNEAEFQKRFIDLFQRHFDRKVAKIFRPQWGVYALGDLQQTLSTLEKHGLQFVFPAGVTETLRYIAQAMVKKIEEVEERERTAKAMGQPSFSQSGDLPELTKVKYTITERFITRTTQETVMTDQQENMPHDLRTLEADNPIFAAKQEAQVLDTDPRRDDGGAPTPPETTPPTVPPAPESAAKPVEQQPPAEPVVDKEAMNAEKAKVMKERFKTAAAEIKRIGLPLNEQEVKQLMESLAATLHAEWQKTSGYETRLKPLYRTEYNSGAEKIDDQMLEKKLRESGSPYITDAPHPKTQEIVPTIDIQNLSYEDISAQWKENNKAGAEFAVGFIHEFVQRHGSLSTTFYEYASEEVHEAWKSRNPLAPPEQLAPYEEMSEELKNKDREHVVLAMELYAKKMSEKYGATQPVATPQAEIKAAA